MHKTEGSNHLLNTFTDGPPGTTVEENFLNAIQNEIVNVIEDSGQTLKTASTETGVQLLEAIKPAVKTFAPGNATPDVTGGKVFLTDAAGLTITDFINGDVGQEIIIISKGAIVFDTTATNLTGSSVNLTTAAGDTTHWVCEDGTVWRLLGFVDISVDNSAGA